MQLARLSHILQCQAYHKTKEKQKIKNGKQEIVIVVIYHSVCMCSTTRIYELSFRINSRCKETASVLPRDLCMKIKE